MSRLPGLKIDFYGRFQGINFLFFFFLFFSQNSSLCTFQPHWKMYTIVFLKAFIHSSASIDFDCPSFFSCRHTWSIWCRFRAKFLPRSRSLSPFWGELPQIKIKHWVRARKGRSTKGEIVHKPKHVGICIYRSTWWLNVDKTV